MGKPTEQAIARNKAGQWLPGQSGNPGGRPKSMRTKVLEQLGEEGMEVFVGKLVKTLQDYEPGDELPDRAKWFLDREWPAVQKIEADVETTTREAPEVPSSEDRDREVARVLSGARNAPPEPAKMQ